MAFCKFCGSEIDEAARFCPGCGANLSEGQAPKIQGNDALMNGGNAPEQPKYSKFYGIILLFLSFIDFYSDPPIVTIVFSAAIIVGCFICLKKRYRLKGFTIVALIIAIICILCGFSQAHSTRKLFSLPEDEKTTTANVAEEKSDVATLAEEALSVGTSGAGASQSTFSAEASGRENKTVEDVSEDTSNNGSAGKETSAAGTANQEASTKEAQTKEVQTKEAQTKEDQTKEAQAKEAQTKVESESQASDTDSSSKASTGGVDPDLKAFLDSYEGFVDKYVDFMKKYMADPGNAISLLSEYTDILAEYENFMDKVDKYDSNSMSTEDAVYYLEVVNRCNQKMLEIY